ncbi:MAG: ribosome recycling factor [Clostridia bacterium]|nr:ribosome recycling factor [Clostridia bacterium]
MQYEGEYTEYRDEMDLAIEMFKEHLTTIRAGRANPAVLNGIMVDYYGVKTPINQIGNISVPDARLIVIQPWDGSIVKDVERAILASNIGINPSNDGKVIRLAFPMLSEERRKEIVKTVKSHGEEAKVKIRSIRRHAIDEFKKQEKASEITEDDLKDILDDIQELTDNHIKDIDKIVKDKEAEVTEV